MPDFDRDLLRISRDVAAELNKLDRPFRWYPHPKEDRRRSFWHPIKTAEGYELHFETTREPGRFVVMGSLPPDLSTHITVVGGDYGRRTFARERPAAVVAREIARDVLPVYRQTWADCTARRDMWAAEDLGKTTWAARLAAIIGEQPLGHDNTAFTRLFPELSRDRRVYLKAEQRTAGSTHLVLDMPPDLAEQVLRLIQDYHNR